LEDADAWEDRPELVLMSGAMLKPAIEELLKRFEEREGVRINTAYAGCGILVAQMKAIQGGQSAGKSFPDAYFSCDVSFMRMVQDWFEASTCISRNDMVLAVARNSRHKHLMRRLLDAILSPESREHFQDVGFHWVAGGEQE
jgi:ABC-type molybdate transport system substrate-binding protein